MVRHVDQISVRICALDLFSKFSVRTNCSRRELTSTYDLFAYGRRGCCGDGRAGKAVPGLQKEDFQVFENGKPQTITFFEPNFGATEAAIPSFTPRSDTFTNIRLADPGGVTNVLLLDALDSWPADEMYAQVQMVKFLGSLPPHLRIGIFTLTPERLNLIWPLNRDSDLLRDAVVGFSSSQSATSATTSAQQRTLLSVLAATQKSAPEAQEFQLAESARALEKFLKHGVGIIQQHNHGANGALQALARYLAGIPGRKNLFWIIGNFPHCVPINACSETIDALCNAGVSLYPIDAWGVDVNMGLGPLDWMHPAAGRFIDSEFWAEATGGKAYHVNDIGREIADAVDHGSRYYTLAYVPPIARRRAVSVGRGEDFRRLHYRLSKALFRTNAERTEHCGKCIHKQSSPAADGSWTAQL